MVVEATPLIEVDDENRVGQFGLDVTASPGRNGSERSNGLSSLESTAKPVPVSDDSQGLVALMWLHFDGDRS